MDPVTELRIELLVARAQLRDSMAFEELVRRYHQRLLFYVRKLLIKRQLADDVVQEVWQIVYRQLPRLRATQAFGVWIYRIAYTEAVKLIREECRYVELADDDEVAESNGAQAEGNFSDNEIESLNLALEKLPLRFREVIVLRYLEGMSYDQISQVAGVPEGTVKSRIFTAKKQLRKEMEDGQHDNKR